MMRKIIHAPWADIVGADRLFPGKSMNRSGARARIPHKQRRLPRFFRAALATTSALAIMVVASGSALAQPVATWKGGAGGDANNWLNGANWDTGTPPTTANRVNIYTGSSATGNDAILGVGNTAATGTTGILVVGQTGVASLTIQGGSILTTTGYARTGGTSTVIVDGTSTKWEIQDGLGLIVGNSSGVTSTLTIRNSAKVDVTTGGFTLGWGSSTDANLNIQTGGEFSTGEANIGGLNPTNPTGGGKATVNGANSTWTVNGLLRVGNGGTGSLTISGNGTVSVKGAGGTVVGALATANGTLNISGGGMLETTSLSKGAGTAQVTFGAGGILRALADNTSFVTGFNAGELVINTTSASTGLTIDTNGFNVTVSSPFSTNSNSTGSLVKTGTGTLTLTSAGSVLGGALAVTKGTLEVGSTTTTGGIETKSNMHINADASGNTASVVVQNGSTLKVAGGFNLNPVSGGISNLTVEGGSTLTSGAVEMANTAGATANATVTGTGSTWTATGMKVGVGAGATPPDKTSATVNIESGGSVTVGILNVAQGSATTEGTVNVDGANSILTVGATGNTGINLTVGQNGIGELNVTNDAIVTNNGDTVVGNIAGSSGTLNINSGGQMTTTGTAYISGQPQTATGTGTVTVSGKSATSGAASHWTVGGSLFVGNSGKGTLNIEDNGVVTSSTQTMISQDAVQSDGTLNVKSGGILETLKLVRGRGTNA
ncbi:beta strand repeat-containing protein, partial [Brucella endophytica]